MIAKQIYIRNNKFMYRLKKLISKHSDKIIHFCAGMLIQTVIGVFYPLLAIGLVVIVAVSVELYDHVSGKGTAGVVDAIITVLGGLIVFISQIIILG